MIDHGLLTSLRDDLQAEAVGLVVPVVHRQALVVGSCLVAREGGVTAHDLGRPLCSVSGVSEPETLRERYHLDGGGVLGPPPDATKYKAGSGLREPDRRHVLAWAMPADAPGWATWLVLDGRAVGFVQVDAPDLPRSRRHRALDALRRLRRVLVRASVHDAVSPTGTGLVMLDSDGGVAGADVRGAAWVEAREGAPWRSGIDHGALVVPATLEGQQARVATVRPIRVPEAPIGLRLTDTQRAVASYLSTSATLKEIADARGSQPSTIETHRDHIYTILGAAHRMEVAQRLRRV